MPIDAAIPLQVNTQFWPNPQQMMSMAVFAQQMRQQKQQQMAQNALRGIFSDPNSMDESGNLRPEALNRVMAIDPATGMQIRGQMQTQQMHQASMNEKLMQTWKLKMEAAKEGTEAALMTYDQAINKGVPEAQARTLAQEIYDNELKQLKGSGHFSENEFGKINPVFDPNRSRAGVMKYKDWLTAEEKKKADARAEKKESETERHNLATERHQSAMEAKLASAAKGTDVPELDKDTVDYAAEKYNATGQLPTFGFGKAAAALRTQILQRAAHMAKEKGKSGVEVAADAASFKAGQSALSQLQRSEAMVGAFEKNFNMNADLALQISGQVGRTGVPVLNRWLLAGKKSIAGDPDVANFDVAMKSVVNEYTKIISGSMGNTVMAEGEIKKVENLLNSAQTPEQVKSVIAFMKKETGNRMKGFEEKRKEIMKGLSGKPDDAKSPAQTKDSGTTRVSSDAEYAALPSGALFIGPDGKTRRKP